MTDREYAYSRTVVAAIYILLLKRLGVKNRPCDEGVLRDL